MNPDPELIDAMFARHGASGPWEALPSTGLANHIFATRDVLRVATDHSDGVVDARTESVAAPVAREAGVLTPRLIAFDDTRTLVDRPFSLWERVHGETLGLTNLPPRQLARVWRAVGCELGRLHLRVRACADPKGYLDEPERNQDVDGVLRRLVDAKKLDIDAARRVERLADELRPQIAERSERRFIHNDIHSMNIMCSAVLGRWANCWPLCDWGDAGCGDPSLDFAAIPFDAIRSALLASGTASPHDAALDRALREAAAALSEPDMPVLVEIAASWLRVETSGGSWLGARFARRIEELIAFADRLLRLLAGRFTPGDSDAWLVERRREDLQLDEPPTAEGGP